MHLNASVPIFRFLTNLFYFLLIFYDLHITYLHTYINRFFNLFIKNTKMVKNQHDILVVGRETEIPKNIPRFVHLGDTNSKE